MKNPTLRVQTFTTKDMATRDEPKHVYTPITVLHRMRLRACIGITIGREFALMKIRLDIGNMKSGRTSYINADFLPMVIATHAFMFVSHVN
jgi:hypothetical protein